MHILKLDRLIEEISSHTIRAIRLFGRPGFSSHHTSENSLSDASKSRRDNIPSAGGYNEAFIIQNWANYGPLN
jgi:hypothetical protein